MHKNHQQLVWFTVLRAEGRFSKHALILRPGTSDYKGPGKGIRKEEILKNTFSPSLRLTRCRTCRKQICVRCSIPVEWRSSKWRPANSAIKFYHFVLHANGRFWCNCTRWDCRAADATIPQSLFALTYQCIKCKYEESVFIKKAKQRKILNIATNVIHKTMFL